MTRHRVVLWCCGLGVISGSIVLIVMNGVQGDEQRVVYTEIPYVDSPGSRELFVSDSVDLVLMVNERRVEAGCNRLESSRALTQAAQDHSVDMAEHGHFSHNGVDGRSFYDRARDSGYRGSELSENIAMGYTSPELTLDAWMDSPAHREVIIKCTSELIGVGVANGGESDYYWTILVGR